MGMYDTVAGLQVKATPDPGMKNYEIGDKIPLSDGAYLCYGGVFIVTNGTVAAAAEKVYDKWGDGVDIEAILNPGNPVSQAIQSIREEKANG